MIKRIKNLSNKDQETLADIAIIALFLTPVGMTFANTTTVLWMVLSAIVFNIGWISAYLKNAIITLVCIVALWTFGYISTITEWDDYGYGIGTLIFIPCILYWLFNKYGFKKLLKESKERKDD